MDIWQTYLVIGIPVDLRHEKGYSPEMRLVPLYHHERATKSCWALVTATGTKAFSTSIATCQVAVYISVCSSNEITSGTAGAMESPPV